MYDEYERAMTGREKPRLGLLGWIGLSIVGLMLTGTAVAVFAFFVVKNKVEEAVAREGGPEAVVERILAEVERELETELANVDEIERVELERALRSIARVERAVQVRSGRIDVGDLVEGSLRVTGSDGERFSLDLRGDESGGFLVIESGDERLTFDLARDDDGAALVVRSADGEEIRVGAGDRALEVPAWIPEIADRPARPRHLYSARSDDGWAGAVVWETDLSPDEVVEAYAAEFERAGLRLETEARAEGRDGRMSLKVAEADGDRSAVVAAASDDGRTTVFLGYKDRR